MAQVQFYRVTAAQLESLAKKDGRLVFTTDTHKLYLDNGTSRVQIDGVDFTYGLSLSGNSITITKNGGNGSITLPVATTSSDGLMSASDKEKLDGIAKQATRVLVDSSITSSSTNPVQSKAIYSALGKKLDTSLKGASGGLAELDSDGKVPAAQLPSYVDDVLEYASKSSFPTTGETGKIYVATDTNLTYRWSGSAYIEISQSLALGETSSTAYRGDRGKAAYDHSLVTSGNPHNVTKSDVGLGNVGNFKAVSTVASQGLSDTEKSNARANIGAGTSSLTLGTTSSTAYRGDYGNAAYRHGVTNKGSAFASGLYKITTNDEGHVTAATAVAKSDITALGIPSSDTTYSDATQTTHGLMSTADKTKVDKTNIGYGTCSTAAATAEKAITINDTNWKLEVGSIIVVKFSATNTADNPKFNVNGTGAKSVWYNTGVLTTGNKGFAGTANRPITYMYDGTNFVYISQSLEANDNTVPSAYCSTAATTAAKTATCTGYVLLAKSYLHVIITVANTSQTALTLNVNSKGAKPIYINGAASSTSNYTLPAGSYIVYYDGTNYYFRTDGKLTADITGTSLTDSALSTTSTNPVQNKIITNALNNKIGASDITITQSLTAGAEVGKIKVGNTTTTLYAPEPGDVKTDLASSRHTYFLTGVTTTTASDGSRMYNTRVSDTHTGVKYETSTSAEGGTLSVDDREVTLGLYYTIA